MLWVLGWVTGEDNDLVFEKAVVVSQDLLACPVDFVIFSASAAVCCSDLCVFAFGVMVRTAGCDEDVHEFFVCVEGNDDVAGTGLAPVYLARGKARLAEDIVADEGSPSAAAGCEACLAAFLSRVFPEGLANFGAVGSRGITGPAEVRALRILSF